MRRLFASAAILAVSACGGDAGAINGPGAILTGVAGTRIGVEFTVVDTDGRAAEGVVVTFALAGAPAGTSLSSTSELSDEEGRVSVGVTAPEASSFDVEASALNRGVAVAAIEVGEPPPRQPYDFCASGAECAAAEECISISTSVTNGSMCSSSCSADAQCAPARGLNGACLDPDGAGGICFQECDVSADCSSDSVCVDFIDFDGVNNFICLPDRL